MIHEEGIILVPQVCKRGRVVRLFKSVLAAVQVSANYDIVFGIGNTTGLEIDAKGSGEGIPDIYPLQVGP